MLSQAYVAYELNLSYWAGFNRVYELGFAGMDNNCNSIAAVTGTGLAFFLGIRQKNIYLKCFCFYCAGLMAHIPMIAMSRGGMLGLCVTGVVSFFILQRKPIHYLFFALAVVLGMRLAGPAVMQRFSSTFVDEGERDKSAQSRIEMWIACWDLTLRYPIFGVGPSNWGRYAPEYEFPAGKEAHTLWLQTSAEMGFPGIGLLLAFYGFTCWRLFKLIIRPPPGIDPFHLDVARMVIAALAGFAASATFVTIIGLEIPYYICAMGAASLKVWAMESTQATQNQTWGIAPQLAGAAYAPQAQPHA
jgi:O-antigen ligase